MDSLRRKVDFEFRHLSKEARDSIYKSLKSIRENRNKRPKLIKVDFGKDAGKNIKKELFNDTETDLQHSHTARRSDGD